MSRNIGQLPTENLLENTATVSRDWRRAAQEVGKG